MASPQQHLDDHYGDVGFRLVDDDGEAKPGMSPKEASAFLRALRPVARVKQTLAQAARAVKKKG